MPMGRQGRTGGYVITQPNTFETSMDEWMMMMYLPEYKKTLHIR
jgi:hypothetical protein